MPKRKQGDYIPSWWENDYQREEYVAGHVDAMTALATISKEIGTLWDATVHPLPPVRHAYMHNGFAGESMRSDGCEREMRIYDEPRSGRTKVTIVKYADLGFGVKINGVDHRVPELELTYEKVLKLAGFREGMIVSMVWRVGRHENGTLFPGKSVKTVDGMYVDACDTSNA